MKLLAVILACVIVVGVTTVQARLPERCRTGEVRGFAAVTGTPELGMASITSRFSNNQSLFSIRYNCIGRSVFVRRVDRGIFDVWFRDNPGLVPSVDAMSDQGTSSSVDRVSGSTFRVVLRGPLIDNNVTQFRDIPFYITVF